MASNTDFRKFDDGLKMTVDIDSARLEKIQTRLEQARLSGTCYFGLHEQEAALMTCIVPSPLSRDHMHFVRRCGRRICGCVKPPKTTDAGGAILLKPALVRGVSL